MPNDRPHPNSRSVLYSFKFVGTALVGSAAMALVSAFAPLPAQIAALGACVSVLAGLFVAYVEQEEARERRRNELLEKLRVPVALAPEHQLFDQYTAFAEALADLAKQPDPVLRRFALVKLASINDQVRSLAQGRVVFTATEAWRAVYDQLLQDPGLKLYRSVARVRDADYWQDAPGRQSMRLNFEMAQKGLRIERIAILRGDLWPPDSPLPAPSIRPWIEAQHDQGIDVRLIREAEVAEEPDLLVDFGIYGERAVGTLESDERGRTTRFVLQFDRPALEFARERWERLALYGHRYLELLDRTPAPDV